MKVIFLFALIGATFARSLDELPPRWVALPKIVEPAFPKIVDPAVENNSIPELENLFPKLFDPLPEIVQPEAPVARSPDASCSINVNGGLQEPQPLIIKPGTSEWVYPSDRRGIVELSEGERIEVFCTNGFANRRTSTNIILTCSTGTTFADDAGARNDFKWYSCVNYPTHEAVRTSRTCFEGARVIEVGFRVGSRFLKIMEICFDERLERTHYVSHEFSPAYVANQAGFPRPSGWYFSGYFNGKNVDNLYTRNTQRNTIARILGSADLALQYIPETTDFFLARGHLAAKTDFVYGVQHNPTFWMMNVHPQWQVFNGGNWQQIEDGIKKFVADRNINVDAYTGTFGTATLKDGSGTPREIYLAFDNNNNGLIPVPKLYYKILVDRATQNGIVIIGVNNPYLTLAEIQRDYIICSDVGNRITWINWRKEEIARGYSYACDVNDFFRVVKHLPFVTVRGLLI